MAIFGLIGLVSSQMLIQVVDAQQRNGERAERFAAMQRTISMLERDLLQAADRPVRDEFGDPLPALTLRPDGDLELTRHGWSNPLGLPRSSLQRVGWSLDDEGRLSRRFWTVLDRAPDSSSREQALLEDVQSFRVELLDADGGTWNSWPPDDLVAEPEPLLPDMDDDERIELVAVRVELHAPPFGRVERLLPLPMPAPPAEATLPGDDPMPADEDPIDAVE